MYRVNPLTFDDTSLVSSTVGEGSAWDAATNYAIGDLASRPNHRRYKALVAGVDATIPENNTAKWLDYEATDRWKPFDYFSNITASASNPSWVLEPTDVADMLLLFGVSCESVTVLVEDGATLQNETFDMLVEDTADDFFSWIMSVPEPLLDRAIPLVFLPGATITITLNGAATWGKFVVGFAENWGAATWDTSLTHRDMTRVVEDDFGISSTTPRGGFFDLNFRVAVAPAAVPMVKRRVQAARGKVAAYLGSSTAIHGSMALGIMRSMDLDYGNPGLSNYSLAVRSTV